MKDANLLKWTLSTLDMSVKNAKPQVLLSGTTEQVKKNIGQLDPTLLENGIYGLVLNAAWEAICSGQVFLDTF